MKRKNGFLSLMAFVCLLLNVNITIAQIEISGQLRTRPEFRNGQGSPLPKNSDPAFFISQRTRLNVDYSSQRLKFGAVLQDVRVWGQDVSTINRTTTQNNNGLMLHEAWAEILLTDTADKNHRLSAKFGRQEIILDDERLIGNLNWLQQARHHDALLLKYQTGHWKLTAGGAYNQNRENAAGTVYQAVPPGNYSANSNGSSVYKSFEFIHVNRQLKQGQVSFLLFADQFNKFRSDSALNKTWEKGNWPRFTTGLHWNQAINLWNITASAYYQSGKTHDNLELNAALISASVLYKFTPAFTAGPGIDFTTGGISGKKSQAFDPLYGTPHKFWGNMDYFYAGNGFGNTGLTDGYIKSSFQLPGKFKLNADLHQFFSASNITNAYGKKQNRYFGTEIDLVLIKSISPVINIEAGYSHFFSTSSLVQPSVKNIANAQSNNDWAYLMITIRPVFFRAAINTKD